MISEIGNLRVIHRSKPTRASFQKSLVGKNLKELLSIFGVDYLLGLFDRGVNYADISELLADEYDAIIRVSFDSNQIPALLQRERAIPVFETPLAVGLPRLLPSIRRWFIFIDRKSFYTSSTILYLRGIWERLLIKLELSRLVSKRIIAVSSQDAIEISRHQKAKIGHVLPLVNSVPPCDLDLDMSARERLGVSNILFFSSYGIASSIAVEFILKIAGDFPHSRFLITGFDGDAVNTHLAKPDNVVFCGYCNQTTFDSYLKMADVVIFPLVISSGVQTKLIKALAFGKAILTTSSITRTIDNLVEGMHLLVEDDPHAFTEKLKSVLSNRDLINSLGANARRYYCENLESSIQIRRFSRLIEDGLE